MHEQTTQTCQIQNNLSGQCHPGNFFRHLEQPRIAACPKKPHTFLDAGISQATQSSAHRTDTLSEIELACILTPSSLQNASNSCTRGSRKALTSCLGSLGPGKRPTSNTFSYLNISRYISSIVRYIAPMLATQCK